MGREKKTFLLVTAYDRLPERMRTEAVRPYAERLFCRRGSLLWKRILEILLCGTVFLLTLPLFFVLAGLVKATSPGPVFFRQERIGRDLKPFFILKFRTMTRDAEQTGVQLTTGDDARITSFGKLLRSTNLDEMPQLLNVLKGDMSVVGTRPEVLRFVERYTDEMYATLLLAPGMLSEASIRYKDENDLLTGVENPQEIYVGKILPDKMKYNLEYLKKAGVGEDLRIIGRSIACMFHA